MSIADELRLAGLDVIEGRKGIGGQTPVSSIDVRITETPKAQDGTPDLNGVVAAQRAVAYVQRSGRVWLLADGPVTPGPAVVLVAAYRDADINEAQQDATDALVAVLDGRYGLVAAEDADPAAESNVEAAEATTEGDTP